MMIAEQQSDDPLRTIVNPVIKDQVTFVATSGETQGSYTQLAVTLMPGGGTPMHYHEILTETFEVISGTLGLVVDGRPIRLQAGNAVTVFPGMVHRFYNDTDAPVRFQTIITPGSRGFEWSLRILYGLAADGRTTRKAMPRSLTHLAIVSDISDMHATGVLSLMGPLLRRLAGRARKNGSYDHLILQYCRD